MQRWSRRVNDRKFNVRCSCLYGVLLMDLVSRPDYLPGLMMKRRFWFGCPHKFSFPFKSSDGSYYEVCIHCGAEYGYDWSRKKRTKPLRRQVQRTFLDQGRQVLATSYTKMCSAVTVAANAAEGWVAVAAGSTAYRKIYSAVRVVANAAASWAAAARRWSLSSGWQIRLAPVVFVVLLSFAYVVVHRSGRTIPEQKSPEAAALVVAVDSTTSSATSTETTAAASEAPSAPSKSNRPGGGRKLKAISGVQHVGTPVLVVGEALVNSQPDGAQVRFDGNSDPVFVTPAVVGSIPPGHHSVVISKPGFLSQTVALEVVAGVRSTVAARLVQKGSVLAISSNPAGAAILLDGKSVALNSPAELRVDVNGIHIITLVQPGFLPAQSQVNVRDGENLSVAFTLIPAGNAANSKVVGGIKRLLPVGASKEMAEVQFKTNPKGARLMLNGWSAPKTTPVELRLPPGGYDVILQADGFKRFSKEIVLEAGKKVVLQEDLERSAGDDRPDRP